MYEVYLDGELLYYPADEECALVTADANLELNTAGTFDFTVPRNNPLYDSIYCRSSMVTILKNGKEIYCGEVREVEKDFYNNKLVKSTGELSFLFDSIQPQAEYHDMTSRQMLETWLNIHNNQVEDRKKFYVGIVTIKDSNDSLYRYTNRETTLDDIREKLIERLEGYLRIRKVDGKRYLDWISIDEYGTYREQPIEFGTNLLDYTENLSAEDIATAVIPLGARLDESPIEALDAYVDITSVNSGKDYVFIQEAVNNFGWVKKVVTWDDVTEPANLKKKGEDWLKDAQYASLSLNLTALDLAEFGQDYEDYNLGDIVPVNAYPYGLDRTFPVQSLSINLLEPDQNELVLGSTMLDSFSKQTSASNKSFSENLESVRMTTAWMQSAIDNATAMMTGSKGGYKVTEYDDDKKWLRDLYMNAPSKEQATRVMQINMNGIGFSTTGFEGPYKNAWTLDGVLLGEFIKAGSVTAEKLSVEYKAAVTSEINTTVTSKFTVAENLINAEVTRAKNAESTLSSRITVTASDITAEVTRAKNAESNLSSRISVTASDITAEVTRATKAEGTLSSRITVNESSISQRVTKNEFGSYVEQYYNRVIIGFNNNSNSVQITAGAVSIYDNSVTESKKRSMFNSEGNHFYRDGYYIGKIGTNYFASDPSKKGLVFDLEYDAAYMTWAHEDAPSAPAYTMIWTYAHRAINNNLLGGTLHAGCTLDMHVHDLYRPNLTDVRVNGWATKTGGVEVITGIWWDNGVLQWSSTVLDFECGILTGW